MKGHIFNAYYDFRGLKIGDVQKNIAKWTISNADGIVRPETVAIARDFIDRTVERHADQGVDVHDLNDSFFLYEEEGRRVGQVMHPTTFLRDTYSPYFSRSVMTAAFTIKERFRRIQPFHYGLLEELAPQLLKIPFDKGSWRSRSPSLNFYRELVQQVHRRLVAKISARFPRAHTAAPLHFIVKDAGFERLNWLQQIRINLRDTCLDDRNSAIWDFVERKKFDALTAESTSADDLSRNANILFLVATVNYYAAFSRRLAAD